jgi:hypothetical protein
MPTELVSASFTTYIGEDRSLTIPYTGGSTTLSGAWQWVATPITGHGAAIVKSTATSGLSLDGATGIFTLSFANADTALLSAAVYCWRLERTTSGLDTWSAKGLWTLKGA